MNIQQQIEALTAKLAELALQQRNMSSQILSLMDELDKLEKNRPDTKRYYSVLVDTFRLYISRKKGITSLQKTTDDLVVQLKQLELGKSEFDRLAQALRLSDFVKFAKYEPEAVDDRQTMETIRESIKVIEKSTPDTGKKEGGG